MFVYIGKKSRKEFTSLFLKEPIYASKSTIPMFPCGHFISISPVPNILLISEHESLHSQRHMYQ